jgi:hypothetical protein
MSYKCDLILNSSAEHLTQILTGFGLLEAEHLIQIKIAKADNYDIEIMGKPILRVIFNDDLKIVYDTFDGSALYKEDLEWSDLYFKRSFDITKIKNYQLENKVFPLGFNYSAYGPRNFNFQKFLYSITSIKSLRSLKNIAISVIRTDRVLSFIFSTNLGRHNCYYKNFECLPHFDPDPLIVFFARLWDPGRSKSAELINERMEINQMRINIIRGLRKEFGDKFYGGLSSDEFTEKIAKDCIVENQNLIKKKSYMALVKNSNICIATQGLLGSNGWKLAEYVASAKSIVSEKLNYSVPGDFLPGKNYLEFSNSDECINQVYYLAKNPEARYQMMLENFNYYNQYLRPDMLVWNTLKIALQK